MVGEYPGQVVRVMCTLLAPIIMMFGIYVVAHGHYGPGGGFAGGVVIGVGIILLRITLPREVSHQKFPPIVGPAAAALGVLGFIATGAVSMMLGGEFLDYGVVDAFGGEPSARRYLGILLVEAAVGLAVAGVMLSLFDSLARAEQGTEPEAGVLDS
jgi:multicomponent Na+:H+ antiporter subunit B